MNLRTVKIKRSAHSDRYVLAAWYLENFPCAVVLTPESFGYVRFQQ